MIANCLAFIAGVLGATLYVQHPHSLWIIVGFGISIFLLGPEMRYDFIREDGDNDRK